MAFVEGLQKRIGGREPGTGHAAGFDLGWFRINPFRAGQEVVVEVSPLRVEILDQLELPGATPAFDLGFASDRIDDIAMFLKPDELMDAIFGSEGRCFTCAVLPDAVDEIAGDAAIECAVSVGGEEVDEGALHAVPWTPTRTNSEHVFVVESTRGFRVPVLRPLGCGGNDVWGRRV